MRFLISIAVVLLAMLGACSDLNPLGLGDHCNPNRNVTDDPGRRECGGGLTCVTPDNCTQAVCCPADMTNAPPGMVVDACHACPPP